MAYDDEEQQRRSRVVIDTPSTRREVAQTVVARTPRSRGISPGVVAALIIGSVALVTLLFLFILNRRADDTTVTSTQTATSATPLPAQQQPIIIQQQPTPQQQQQPIIIQQPATEQPPVIIQQPAPPPASEGATARPAGSDDTAIQSEIDKRMAEDAKLSTLAVTATVSAGKVTLIGTVDTQVIKSQVERLVRAIKGVKNIDNQIIVSGG